MLVFLFLSIYPSIHLSIHPSIHPPLYPSTLLSIHPSIHPLLHPSTSSIHPPLTIQVLSKLFSLSFLPSHQPFFPFQAPPPPFQSPPLLLSNPPSSSTLLSPAPFHIRLSRGSRDSRDPVTHAKPSIPQLDQATQGWRLTHHVLPTRSSSSGHLQLE